MVDGPPNFQSSNRNNCAVDFSISSVLRTIYVKVVTDRPIICDKNVVQRIYSFSTMILMAIFSKVSDNDFVRERQRPVKSANLINTVRYLANGAR